MENFIPVLQNTQLFRGVGEGEITAMLRCLGARSKSYPAGAYVYRQGEYVRDIAILVKGQLHICRDDYWGNANILSVIGVGEMFGEAYVAPNSGSMVNQVIAMEDSTVIFFDARRVLTTCDHACPFHVQVVQNLFYSISNKNRKLVQKLGYMSGRTTREKLMSYLSDESRKKNSAEFTIPFNRQQLADFLSVDRSAMSSELGKMRREGLITFRKNQFTLLKSDHLSHEDQEI